jgi:prophage regulatory protein
MWNIKRVKEFTTLSKATIYRLIKAGKFPAPILISTRRAVWRESDILNFISTK